VQGPVFEPQHCKKKKKKSMNKISKHQDWYHWVSFGSVSSVAWQGTGDTPGIMGNMEVEKQHCLLPSFKSNFLSSPENP
jgi:hypothetical protein